MSIEYGLFADFSIRQKIIFGLVLVKKDDTKFVGLQLLNKFSAVHRTQSPAVIMSESDFFPKAIVDEIGGQRIEVEANDWLDVEVNKLNDAMKMFQMLEGVANLQSVDSETVAGIKEATVTPVKIKVTKKPRKSASQLLAER